MRKLTMLLILFTMTSCATAATDVPAMETPVEPEKTQAYLPNPASVYCEDNGFIIEMRTDEDGNQYGLCIFPDGSECDEWAYFRGECSPASEGEQPDSTNATPTPLSFDPADYLGWWTYTHPELNFKLMLPEDWIVEDSTGDTLLAGHILNIHPEDSTPGESAEGLNIRMTFREAGEDVLLWPTGVGEGEFIQEGTLNIAGQPARRLLLVCPTGEITAIWYQDESEGQPNISRSGMEFAFIISIGTHCTAGASLEGKLLSTGEMVIASLVP